MLNFEDPDNELHDYEYPDAPEENDEIDDDYISCNECHELIYEDAEQCPYCGAFVENRSKSISGFPPWLVAIGMNGIIITIALLSGILQFF